jgi:hypothetical protein
MIAFNFGFMLYRIEHNRWVRETHLKTPGAKTPGVFTY